MAKATCFFLFLAVRSGFLSFVTALNQWFLRTLLTVCAETRLGMMELMWWAAWTALAALPVVI